LTRHLHGKFPLLVRAILHAALKPIHNLPT
jgi:hypothetical protein